MFYVSELICVNNKSIFNIFEMYISYEQLVTCEKCDISCNYFSFLKTFSALNFLCECIYSIINKRHLEIYRKYIMLYKAILWISKTNVATGLKD